MLWFITFPFLGRPSTSVSFLYSFLCSITINTSNLFNAIFLSFFTSRLSCNSSSSSSPFFFPFSLVAAISLYVLPTFFHVQIYFYPNSFAYSADFGFVFFLFHSSSSFLFIFKSKLKFEIFSLRLVFLFRTEDSHIKPHILPFFFC